MGHIGRNCLRQGGGKYGSKGGSEGGPKGGGFPRNPFGGAKGQSKGKGFPGAKGKGKGGSHIREARVWAR
eukprot:8157249-Karenia_brevis.AAC.1